MNPLTTIVPPAFTRDVLMRTTLVCGDGPRMQGRVYAEPIPTAAEWIRTGVGTASETPPRHVIDLLARLDDGANAACVFLPFVGEFGHLLMSHVRIVHFHRAATKIVCCRRGEESLFPSAFGFVTDWTDPVADADRIATMRDKLFEWPDIRARFPSHHFPPVGRLTAKQEIHPIRAGVQIPFAPIRRGYRADVVFGIRRRDFCPERNWPHWPTVAASCRAAGLSYAVVGAADTSFDVEGQVIRTKGDTDAALELLQTCRLYVGTDSGNSHLAAAAGAPMLLFRETAGGSRDLTPNMATVNPNVVRLLPPAAWSDPQLVVRGIHEALQQNDHAATTQRGDAA